MVSDRALADDEEQEEDEERAGDDEAHHVRHRVHRRIHFRPERGCKPGDKQRCERAVPCLGPLRGYQAIKKAAFQLKQRVLLQ